MKLGNYRKQPYWALHNRAKVGTGDIGTINSNDRVDATIYSLGACFVSGIYV
jgi:hypothetical protein